MPTWRPSVPQLAPRSPRCSPRCLLPRRSCDLELPTERIGSYETQLVEHFFQSLANTSGMTLHIRQARGLWWASGLHRVAAQAADGAQPMGRCRRALQRRGAAPAPALRLPLLPPGAGRQWRAPAAARCRRPPDRLPPRLSPLQLAGRNSHHIVEATFKAFARALRHACEADPRRAGTIASSKGVLTQA